MKNRWNEMSKFEKYLYVINLVFCFAGLIFAMLDIHNGWEHAHLGWCICLSVYLIIEGVAHWNKTRNIAIVELACAIVVIGFQIFSMCI